MKKIAILGSTGSIGTQTLEIVRNNKDLKVVAMAAGTQRGIDGETGTGVSTAAGMYADGGSSSGSETTAL